MGLANAPTRLALKAILSKYTSDFCFLAEPWMRFQNFLDTIGISRSCFSFLYFGVLIFKDKPKARSLICLNEALNLKLCWDLNTSLEDWDNLHRERTIWPTSFIKHHIPSSIWKGIKPGLNTINSQSIWILGGGKSINFWGDSWCGSLLVSELDSNSLPPNFNLNAKVCDFCNSNSWNITVAWHNFFPFLKIYFLL
ncbi:unnamed protein product [Vicia faba]|uniref:Reverse transcriptase zinc-binding domain-containing protein n=1 Tax=Vicia faba TaxID=3906 RepID=A0AAV0Z4X8_VICFA|nr:unnamed protein product [Vicia faba]